MEAESNFSLLHAKLSRLGFADWSSLNEGDVMTGNPHAYAVFLRFLYQRFPAATTVLLRKFDWFVLEWDDGNLGATTVRLVSTVAPGTVAISAVQFKQCKYAMAKVNLCHALLRLLRSLTPVSGSPVKGPFVSAPKAAAIEGRHARSTPQLAIESSAHLSIKERRSSLNSLSRT